MLYMVIERFRPGKLQAIYARATTNGRMLPTGIEYIESWVTDDMARCFQLMRADNEAAFAGWIEKWSDLTDFDIVPVISSREATARVLGHSDVAIDP